MITYVLTHPQLSEPLEMDAAAEHTDTFLANAATFYILRHFDEMVDRRAWTVTRKEAP